MFEGSIVAMVTPFRGKRQEVDTEALGAMVERQIDQGTSGIVVCGTTGESPTLTEEDFRKVVEVSRDAARGRVPIIVGTGSNDTRRTIEKTRLAKELGADAALVVVPYYNKPNPAGLKLHFAAVARVGGLPVVAYSVPGRTGLAPDLDTLVDIGRTDGVVALKEASGDIGLACDLAARLRGTDVALLSGDDPSAIGFWAAGGRGTISVTANVAPKACADAWAAFSSGDLTKARELHLGLMPLHRAMFMVTSPIPVKEALHQMGLCNPDLRPPLVRMGEEDRERIREVLSEEGLVP